MAGYWVFDMRCFLIYFTFKYLNTCFVFVSSIICSNNILQSPNMFPKLFTHESCFWMKTLENSEKGIDPTPCYIERLARESLPFVTRLNAYDFTWSFIISWYSWTPYYQYANICLDEGWPKWWNLLLWLLGTLGIV